MTEERTFRIHWNGEQAQDVTAADMAGAFRQLRAIVDETSDDDLPIELPVTLVDLRTGATIDLEEGWFGVPVAEGVAELNKLFGAGTAGIRNLQHLSAAHSAILRHIEGYGDADLRLAAARIGQAVRHLQAEVPAVASAPALDRLQRADVVTARETLRRIAGGHDADPDTAASMLDRVLASTCPHDASEHHTAPDPATGRPLTTCYGCGVSWYADYGRRLATVPSGADGEG